MTGVLALVAASVIGIDVGWEELPDGGFEYIIQIEPQTLESMQKGQDITSQMPPSVQGMRGYRITVGNAQLPHQGEPPPTGPSPAAPAQSESPAPASDTPPAPEPAFGAPPTESSAAGAATTANPAAATPQDMADADRPPPPTLPLDSTTKDISTRTAAFVGKDMTEVTVESPPAPADNASPETAGTKPAAQDTQQDGTKAADSTSDSPPWMPLFGTALALCASVAANVFQGWNTLSLRSRYRALVAQLPGK